jgi:hypothetical protein
MHRRSSDNMPTLIMEPNRGTPLMGIRFACPNGHQLHVKEYLAGKRGICPSCGAKFVIPADGDSVQSAPVAVPAELTARSNADAAQQAANPSIIIPLAGEKPIAPVSSSPAPQIDVFSPPVSQPIPQVDAVLSAGPSPVVITESEQPTSPATTYVAHRERVRRNRTRIAIVLLLLVILLAGVLVWMLVAGPPTSGGSQGATTAPSPAHLASHAEQYRVESTIGRSGDEF